MAVNLSVPERSQKTDKIDVYAICDLDDPDLSDRLAEWQFYYNWQRPHGALNGKTPMQRAAELGDLTPYWDEVGDNYDPKRERLQYQNYQVDLKMRKLQGSP